MSAVMEASGPTKVDFTELFSHLYRASDRHVDVVNVPRMYFVVSDPREDAFTEDTFRSIARSMRRLSLALQMDVKAANVMDYRSMPLECIWDPASGAPDNGMKPSSWTLMIMQPVVNHHQFDDEYARFVDSGEIPTDTTLSLKVFNEGLCVQLLHRGPIFDEWKTRGKLHDYIVTHGYEAHGSPHTIYLQDPGETPGSTPTAIVRQPILPIA